MSQFQKWAQNNHSPRAQILGMLLPGVVFLLLLPYWLLVICPSLDESLGLTPPSPSPATVAIGVALLAVGFPLGLWSVYAQLTRGDGTPLPVMPTKRLLVTGPFRYCRNPMALGTILAYLGLAIARVTPCGIFTVVVLGTLLLIYIKRVEEKELADRFGEAYLRYKGEVPFVLPRLRRRN